MVLPSDSNSLDIGLIAWWLFGGVDWAAFESSPQQATPGKMALDLVVTTDAGRRVSLLRAVLRYISKQVNGFTLGIGYLMAGWTRKKQALHDKMTGCVVIRR